jgi:cytochrome c1
MRRLRPLAPLAPLALVAGALALAGCAPAAPAEPTFGDARQGLRTIQAHGCGACHVIPGVPGASGTAGPPLTDYARRGYVAGALPNTPENLARWIRTPQAIEPGTAMPDLGIGEAEARDIVAYLYTLK